MISFWKLAVLPLCFCGACMATESQIYALTEKDGSVVLSNVPTDESYTLLVGEKPAPTPAVAATAGTAIRRTLFDSLIERAARQYGLQSELLHAVIAVESGYDPHARSPKGAGGLMQLMPGTAKRYGVTNAFDPEQNINGGARYLRDLMKLFNGELSLVLAAYNAGENAVRRNQNRIPQYRETVAYVPKVLSHYNRNLAVEPGRRARRLTQ